MALLQPCMPITTGTTLGLVKLVNHDEFALFVACNDHLGYALAIVDYEVFLRQVD